MADSLISENEASTSSSTPHCFSVPKPIGNDMYHVFISFSSTDSTWVHELIHKLEVSFPSIKICTHDRDFTAGKTIMENMTACIQRSQKVLMVLSPDFVHSRWCLFEASLSMFQDFVSHKAIVPVMLKPCLMPLYLSHLTYLEVEDEQFFKKLCIRLLKNDTKETNDVLVHFHSSILYDGKHLLTLAAVNEYDDTKGFGVFSDTCVPDSLRAVVKDPELYKKAIRLINDTSTDVLPSKWTIMALLLLLGFTIASFIVPIILTSIISELPWWLCMHLMGFTITFIIVSINVCNWKKLRDEKIAQIMSRKTGEANLLLVETSILAGCTSRSSLVFVFVSLKKCKDLFIIAFGNDNELAKRMWEKAILKYSSDYANGLGKNYLACDGPKSPGHSENSICFCQYVAMRINQGDWP